MNFLKQLHRYSRLLLEYLFLRRCRRGPSGNCQKELSLRDELPPDQESLGNEGPVGLVNTQPRLKIPLITNEPARTETRSNPEVTKIARSQTAHGGKRVGSRWVFNVVAGLDLGRQYLATTTEIKIGRKPENHIYLRDPKVSRYHAVVKINGSHLTLVDLESTNGTSINETRIHSEKKLFSGDRIKVGETVIQVVSQPW